MEKFTKKDMDDFRTKRIGVNCKTKELAMEFLSFLDDSGWKWISQSPEEHKLLDFRNFYMYEDREVYHSAINNQLAHFQLNYNPTNYDYEVKSFEGWIDKSCSTCDYEEQEPNLYPCKQCMCCESMWTEKTKKSTTFLNSPLHIYTDNILAIEMLKNVTGILNSIEYSDAAYIRSNLRELKETIGKFEETFYKNDAQGLYKI